MTLQTDVRTDGRTADRTDAGFNNIPAFSSKSAGIRNDTVVKQKSNRIASTAATQD